MQAVLPFPDIGPEIVTIPLGGIEFALRWYALAYIVGILIGWRLLTWLSRHGELWADGKAPFTAAQAEEFLTWSILGIILGGRLGFVLFYQPGHYLANPLDIPKVWMGGMSFHGGFAGVIVATILFCRRHAIRLSGLADGLALASTPGLFLGRVANFINAELWGRPSQLPWAVIFPGEAAQDCPGVAGLCARHPSQLYEALMEGALLFLLLLFAVRRLGWLRQPWRLTGLFLLGYGLARFFVEFFRVADAQFVGPSNPLGHVIQIGAAGVTMGQLLSLPMILIGLALVLRVRRAAAA
jgi:phosphatidylglycerol:prolipoprotein diacylglycerol transferase